MYTGGKSLQPSKFEDRQLYEYTKSMEAEFLIFLTLRDENALCLEWNKGFLVWHFRQCKASFLHGKGEFMRISGRRLYRILRNILIRYTSKPWVQNSVFFYALAITCCEIIMIIIATVHYRTF